jgi:two-component system heavy metal sensor histidine kinase CusS
MAQLAALPGAVTGHHGVYYQVATVAGELLYSSPGMDWSSLPADLPVVDSVEPGNLGTWRAGEHSYQGAAVVFEAAGERYRTVVAINIQFHLQFLRSLQHNLWLITLLVGALTLLAAAYGVYRGHAPLRTLSEKVRAIDADRLSLRLDADAVPVELRDLVQSFNSMLARLDEDFTRLSNFSDDIAHELRTPLTNLITQTQVVLGQSRTASEYRELLYSNLEEQERLAKMVNDMLWLAKSEHGLIRPALAPVKLGDEISRLFEYFEALAEDQGVGLVSRGGANVAHCDREMLSRALSNVLSNAIAHCPRGGRVTVGVAGASEGIAISVHNPGPPIPSEQLGRLFDRFYRGDASRQQQSEHAGLGLAIVKAIVELHGGTIAAASDRRGTTFTLHLPIAG